MFIEAIFIFQNVSIHVIVKPAASCLLIYSSSRIPVHMSEIILSCFGKHCVSQSMPSTNFSASLGVHESGVYQTNTLPMSRNKGTSLLIRCVILSSLVHVSETWCLYKDSCDKIDKNGLHITMNWHTVVRRQ